MATSAPSLLQRALTGLAGLFVGVFCVSAALADPLLIHGAGATFPYPLYSKWFAEYNKKKPDLRFNYQSIGSGGGIKQITDKTVDFGATDAPMTDQELAKAPGIVHVPTVIGAVAISYDVSGVDHLALPPDVLSDIFLGTIASWSDPRIAAANPGVKLPGLAITVVHRADGSGTTAVFTDYLAKVSPTWKQKVGAGKSVKWPGGLGAKGNEGVAGLLRSTPGAIGYVELAYATQNKLPVASLKNRAGKFVAPSVASATAAAAAVAMPADYRVSITDAAGEGAYPIAAFTYLLVYKDPADKARGAALVDFLWWALHDGQKLAPALDYAPLPAPVVARVEATLKALAPQGAAVGATR